jgi:hypothetical protein
MMVALVGALSLWSYTPYAMAQNRAPARILRALRGARLEPLLSVRPRMGSWSL